MTSSIAAAEAEVTSPGPLIEKQPLERYVAPARPSLVGLPRADLAAALGGIGVAPQHQRMRVQQIWQWLYVRGAQSFDAMTTLPKDLRAALAERFTLDRPEVAAEQVSVDGTRKWLLRLPGEIDGRPHEVECVYIPEPDRGTLCISSQVGCTLNCLFCHTGTQRLVRNLTASEIAGQVVLARDRLGDWQRAAPVTGEPEKRLISNVVMMGMGEPLYNFEAVRDGLNVVADGEGLSISKRRITLSTSGVVPNIARAGAEIGVMLAGINDSLADARALVRLVKGIPAKINLIPFNPWPGSKYECSDWEQIEKFSQIVFDAGYASPVRTPRGRDILAACGQLKSATEKLSARERMALRAMVMVE